jgi:integrase
MTVLLDAAGRRRSPSTIPATTPAARPRNKGMRYPADPPTVEEIVGSCAMLAMTVTAGACERWSSSCGAPGCASREALALAEHHLDHRRGSLLVRNGKGGRRRRPRDVPLKPSAAFGTPTRPSSTPPARVVRRSAQRTGGHHAH